MLDIGVDIVAIDRIQAILKSEKSEKFKKKYFQIMKLLNQKRSIVNLNIFLEDLLQKKQLEKHYTQRVGLQTTHLNQ